MPRRYQYQIETWVPRPGSQILQSSNSLAKWFQPLSEPQRTVWDHRRYLGEFDQNYTPPFNSSVGLAKWFEPLSEPQRKVWDNRFYQGEYDYGIPQGTRFNSSQFPNYLQLTEPQRRIWDSRFYQGEYDLGEPPIFNSSVGLAMWYQPMSEPQRRIWDHRDYTTEYFAYTPQPGGSILQSSISLAMWYQPLSDPQRQIWNHSYIVHMPAVSDAVVPILAPLLTATNLIDGSPAFGTPTLTVAGTVAFFTVGGGNVVDVFPVYDVVYTYAALTQRTQ